MKSVFSLVSIFISCVAFAQFNLSFPLSNNQQLIEAAVVDGFFLIRQEYQLEDSLSHKRYTLDRRPDFGSAESIAVLTESGYITHSHLIRPWERDANYEKYKSGTYRPVLSRTLVRTARDTTWREVNLLNPATVLPLMDPDWVSVTDTLSRNGFSCVETDGEVDGWLVFLSVEQGSGDLKLVSYRQKMTLVNCLSHIEPKTANKILGAIYLVPSVDKVGVISFALYGFVIPCEDSWCLMPCTTKGNEKLIHKDETTTELTPVGIKD